MFIYISGRISGTTDFFARFKAAEEKLVKMGYAPLNPVLNEPMGETWEYYMRSDIKKLMECNAIYMLKGWWKSRGARLEWLIARSLKFKVIYER